MKNSTNAEQKEIALIILHQQRRKMYCFSSSNNYSN